MVKTKTQVETGPYRSLTSGGLKMLVLADPTNDLKSAYGEGLKIKNAFDRQRSKVRVDFKATSITLLFVKKNLPEYDIVHFAGHCEYLFGNEENAGWVLRDGVLTAKDINGLAASHSMPQLIFSNACQSANHMLAAAFIASGVRHYVGAIRKVEDEASFVFAREFYAQLIAGVKIGEALRRGRLALIRLYGPSGISWAGYLLYGDPGFSFFSKKEKIPAICFKDRIFQHKRLFMGAGIALLFLALFLGIYFLFSSFNPNSYALFYRARNASHRGMNAEVMKLSQMILLKNPYFLDAYPLLADACYRQGDVAGALKVYFEYCRYSEQRHDDGHLADGYLGLGGVYHLQANYDKANEFYQKALMLARQAQNCLIEATALRKMAVWEIDHNEYTSALELLTKSAELDRPRQEVYAHRYNLACDYFDLGLCNLPAEMIIKSAREFYDKSRIFFEKVPLRINELSDCYFNLGEMYLFEKQYQKAHEYYLLGLDIDF